ncbi:MAG: serine hydrolase [Candidatus Kaiserbacteria bacterium]|nr:serine hydrolase [Candidatus Kaiserbacteria bacterium]
MKWLEFVILASMFALFIFGMYTMFDPLAGVGEKDGEKKNTAATDTTKKTPIVRRHDMRWTEVTAAAPWETRDSGEAFLFQNKLWMMGGINGNSTIRGDDTIDYWKAPHFNDIWYSEDGMGWHQAVAAAEWPPRRSMSVVLFKDKLWMFGGWSPVTGYTNDIWSSTDGIHWTQATKQAEWPAREGQMVEIFQDKIWLIGGVNYDNRETKNDVWYSEDGITWVEAENMPWESRWDHATAVFKGKMYLTGGMNLTGGIFNDVWVTENGLHWRLVTNSPPWGQRQGHAMEVYKGKMWLIGRFNDKKNKGPNNVWYSEDGIRWKKTVTDPQWKGREDFFSAVFKDRVWIFGGMDAEWRWRNDVWQAQLVTPMAQQRTTRYPNPKSTSSEEPILSANSAVAVITSTNGGDQTLFQKNKEKKLPMASITKLMTALVASETLRSDRSISINQSALNGKGVSGRFITGESILLNDALHAILIESNNEIAIAIAETVGREKFIQKMNDRAHQLKMFNTHFFNTTGLDPKEGSENINYTTASDITLLLKHIFENKKDVFAILQKTNHTITEITTKRTIPIATTNDLLTDKEIVLQVLGGKTGTTPRAKNNLTIVAKTPSQKGHIITVILKSEDAFTDTRSMLHHLKNAFEW